MQRTERVKSMKKRMFKKMTAYAAAGATALAALPAAAVPVLADGEASAPDLGSKIHIRAPLRPIYTIPNLFYRVEKGKSSKISKKPAPSEQSSNSGLSSFSFTLSLRDQSADWSWQSPS